jgi:SPP1 family phage portal protein
MQYKLFIMKQVVANKERKFKKGLQRRLELICNYLNFRGASYNYLDISIKFERNEPIDVQTNVATALQLNGFVSKETALSALPSSIVPDVNAEIEKLADEADQYSTAAFLSETEVTSDDGKTESD